MSLLAGTRLLITGVVNDSSVAFAPKRLLGGDFLAADALDVEQAFRTSAYSYVTLGHLLRELADGHRTSPVGLDFDAAGVWPVDDWMGV